MAQIFGVNTPGDKHEFDPERWAKPATETNSARTNESNACPVPSSEPPKRHPETGVDVLIVGAGVGGLMTALECWRKGHNVVGILERNEGPVYSGDIIAVMPSAACTLRHWPDMMRDMEQDQVKVDVTYETHDGKHIFGPTPPSFNDTEHVDSRPDQPKLEAVQIRQRFFRMLLKQVARLGLRVEYGCRASDYFEDEAAHKGGVVIETMGRMTTRIADVVVAADGIHSPSEMLVTGLDQPQRPTSSGMSIYRCSYPTALAMKDALVREQWGGADVSDVSKSWEFWLGPGMYMGVYMSPELVAWGFTPREGHSGPGATESWEPGVDPETVADIMMTATSDWHPAIPALVRTAPKGSVVHWPLLWRNLRSQWTSKGGHIVQVGDSAHTFTPTSGNGATQALEDAITLATCLQLGAQNPALATKIYNLLRYQRVSCAQKMSFVNAELKTDTDWNAIWANPAKIRTRLPVWIFRHNPEAYAYEKYGQAFAHLVAGAPFVHTNTPPEHKFVPWTIEQLYDDMARGVRMENVLDGDWS